MKEMKRIVALVLCLVMLVGYLPVGAQADEVAPVQEPSAITDVVVEEAAAEAEENDEESLTADTGDPLPVEETVSEDENATSEEEAPTAGEAVEEETPAEEEVTEEATEEVTEEVTEEATEEVTEEATEEAVAFELEVDTYVAPLLGADNVVDAAIFFSDLHTNKSDYKESTVKGIMNGLKGSSWNFSSVTSCGDAFSVNEDSGKYDGDPSKITGYIQSVFAGIPVNYVWSDHDRYAGLDNDSGFIYGAGADGTYGTADDGNYYIYELSMADLSTNNRYNADFHSNEEVTATIAAFVADAAKLDQTKPLFIASHQPLLDRRNDNGHALEWATAINEVAETMDVAFFFGHNHKYDVADDYYYAKGSTMSVCKDSSGNAENVKLNFTHLCTGYMEPTSTGSYSSTGTRRGVAVAAAISEDSIRYVTYDKDGVYTGNFKLDATVTRDHAEAETEEPTDPPEGTEPSQPETPDVTIVDASGNAVEAVVAVNNDASVQEAVADLLTNAVAYDIDIEGEVGDIVITLPIPQDVVNPAVYYVPSNGEAPVDMEATKTADGKVSFHTTHNSTYAVGERAVSEDEGDTGFTPETSPGNGPATTTEEKVVYVLVDQPTAGNQYIIVNRNTAGSGYALKENTTTGSSITVNAAGNGVSAPYIETTDASILWNVADGLKLQSENGGYYLRYNNRKLEFNKTSYSNWTYSNNKLSSSYYLRYDNVWTVNRDEKNGTKVYFYEKQTIKNETSTTVSGTYSIAGNPAEVTKVVKNGSTVELNSVLTFTPSDGGTATTTDPSTTATYTVVEGSDIISVSGNTVTFTGEIGEAVVKVSYKDDRMEKTVTNYITVIAAEPTYLLDITKDEAVVTGTTLTKKGVTSTTTLQLGTKVQYMNENGTSPVDLPQGATIEWNIPEEYQSIATVDDNGLITFKGVDGAFYVTATLTVNGKTYTAGVNISATTSLYSVPSDHTSDFPEYPNEGAIRYDKTATAVGNFSQTGIAQVELSMTGVPYTTGSEMDVVLMLDRSSSMYKSGVQHRISSTVEATKVFIQNIVKNADGSFNNNRILVLDFLGGNLNTSAGGGSSHKFQSNRYTTNEDNGYQIINDQAELDALLNKIETDFKGQTSLYGTEYAQGLKACYDALNASRSDGNQQFCVFMSDGIPNYMQCETTHFDSTNGIVGMFDVTNRTAANGTATRNTTKYEYEYYSTQMKNEGVTVFTVGLGLKNTNSAWSGTSKEVCEQVANMLLNDIAGPAGETSADRDRGNTVSKLGSYFFSVADDNAAADMKNVFADIAKKILQAATDVTVEDKITDEYTMIFDIPTTTSENGPAISGVTNDFYIEFGKYALNEDHERTTYTSNTKLYLKNTNGTLSAASDKNGTAYAAPVFAQKTIGDKGTLYYWTTDSSYASKAAVSYKSGNTTYYFIPYGMKATDDGYDAAKWFNMTSGAYANGNVDSTTNMSEDLVIATPYFVYNAAKRMIYWTVDKLDTEEYVLKYFLYLDNSATEVGTNKEQDPGSYPTNEHAYITYTNFNGNDCRQEFPIPQLTWNGAQVSYVFYLVNAKGEPINKSGQVVDFANATFITDVYTEAVVWNKDGDTTTGTGQLSANWLANDLLPDEYEIYDEQARYVLNVYENADGSTIKNQFTISGNTAADISSSLNNRLELNTTASTVSVSTTKVYNTKAGERISAYGTYTSADTSMKDFDFANTTVAFAVVWQPRLVPDAVVVDYGLDVLINVVQNDILQNKVSGIGVGTDAYDKENIAIDTGVSTTSKLGTAALTLDGNTISIENENQIRFHQGDMQFEDSVVFYYETPVEFWEGSDPTEGYMYSSVTVIPATTIYYEDEFVELKTYTLKEGSTSEYNVTEGWDTNSVKATATQAQDRPGESLISDDLDADNIYGYDSAYKSMSKHSLGSAAKVHVDADSYATASFSFYGTGFDVISMTSNTTGVLAVKVVNESGTKEASNMVNTYYGYTTENHEIVYTYTNGAWVSEDKGLVTDETVVTAKPENPAEGSTYTATEQVWVVTPDTENALYQVPVLQIEGLTYGLHTVTITATYAESLDKTSADGYDLYLDAIRIYDPANDGASDKTIQDAYVADGEGWPSYIELRNKLIGKETFGNNDETAKISGVVFIDGDNSVADDQISDYTSYGPNNEVYLAEDQSIAFILEKPNAAIVKNIHLGVKSANGDAVTYTIKNVAKAAINNVAAGASYGEKTFTVNTSTDMYYDITSWSDDIIVITNTSSNSAILSLTNIKATYTENPNGVSLASSEEVPVVKAAAEETGSEVGVYMTPDAAKLTLLSMKQTEEEPEESVPETSEPVETEPEDPSTETTEPEETEPENTTKPTEPEETKPGNQRPSQNSAIKYLTNVLKKLLGGWFR